MEIQKRLLRLNDDGVVPQNNVALWPLQVVRQLHQQSLSAGGHQIDVAVFIDMT
jgi:hypothetical protein